MKSKLLTFGLAILMLSSFLTGISQAADSKLRLGLQGAQFAAGISGIVQIANPWSFQAVADLGADAVAIRILNRFTRKQYWNAYGQGTVGFWRGDGYRPWGWKDDSAWEDRDNNVGLGVGIGVEYDWRGISDSLPPLGWNIELGASIVPGFNLDLGLGVHWMF